MATSELPKKHISAAIIYRDETVLACRRAFDDESGLHHRWELPGGKVEPGESAEEALRREIAEELGCRLQLVWEYDTVEFDYPEFHLTMDVFVCTLAPGAEPELRVHDRFRWLSKAELLDVEWLPADVKLMEGLGLYWDIAFEAQHL